LNYESAKIAKRAANEMTTKSGELVFTVQIFLTYAYQYFTDLSRRTLTQDFVEYQQIQTLHLCIH